MATVSSLLAQAPKDSRESLEHLLRFQQRERRMYGFEVGEDEVVGPMSVAEQREATARMTRALVDRLTSEHGGRQDLEDWQSHWYGNHVLHTRDLPYFGISLILARALTYEASRELMDRAWTLPEWPGQTDKTIWRRAFAATDFICSVRAEGEECDLHFDEWDQTGEGEPLTLYRGALESAKRGLSWTTDRDRALWFVRRGDMTGRGRPMHLYRATVARERTLAHFHHRSESEVVADVHGLKITEETP